MAGGVGSRFWPFSRTKCPKQFLDFFGTGRTLLQMTFDRFKSLVPTENVLVVTNMMYKDLVMEQLPCLSASQILLEPTRRNTALPKNATLSARAMEKRGPHAAGILSRCPDTT